MNVELDGGKYRIEIENGVTTVYRNGEKWQDLTGDNLIYNLVHRVTELTEAANKAAEQLDQASGLVDAFNGEVVDWLIDNQYRNKDLASELRDATEA